MFKKLVLVLLSFLVLGFSYANATETAISNLGNVVGLTKMNNSNTGYYVTQNGSNIYVYNNHGELVSKTNESDSYGYEYSYWGKVGTPYVDLYITKAFRLDGTRAYRYDYINAVDKQTGQILGSYRARESYKFGGPSYNYYLNEDYIVISITEPNGGGTINVKVSLNNNLVEGGEVTPIHLRPIPGINLECNKTTSLLDYKSYCFYKSTDNTGIKIINNNNVTYNFFEDDTISNWSIGFNSKNFILGHYGLNDKSFSSYDYNSMYGTGVIQDSIPTGFYDENKFKYVPYPDTNGFPRYDFTLGGIPLIYTDYITSYSYYIRDNVLYKNDGGSLDGVINENTGVIPSIGFLSTKEGQIANLGNVIGLTKMNNSNTGYYVTQNGSNIYVYNKYGELVSKTNESDSYGYEYSYWGKVGTPYVDLYITKAFRLDGTRAYRYDYINAVDKQTGQILGSYRARESYKFGGPSYNYYLNEDYIVISITEPNGGGTINVKVSLNDNTVEGTSTPSNLRSIPGFNFECNKGEGMSYCFYKSGDKINYIKNDNTTYNIDTRTDTANWSIGFLDKGFILGTYGNNGNLSSSYGYKNITSTGTKLDILPTAYYSGNKYIYVPYSDTVGFPKYDFINGGFPLIYTDYITGYSYYIRDNILYRYNQGSMQGEIIIDEGNTTNNQEGQIANLGNVVGLTKMNNSNTGYYITQNGSNMYVYNKYGELVSKTNESDSYGHEYSYWGKIGTPYVDLYIIKSFRLDGTRAYRYDYINAVDKQTGQILGSYRGRTSYKFGGPSYNYYLNEDYIVISITEPNEGGTINVKVSLNDNTVEGTSTPLNLRSLQSVNYECNKKAGIIDDTSYCFYKTEEGIKYDTDDSINNILINDNSINQRAIGFLDESFLLGTYTSNNFGFSSYDYTNMISSQNVENSVPTAFYDGDKYKYVPYSNTNGFPRYDFTTGGLPLIFTDYMTGNSYYTRDGLFYTNKPGSLGGSTQTGSETVTLPLPKNLKQYVQSPELEREEFGSGTEIGTKIGKYQSGSGIILSATIDNNSGSLFSIQFQVYRFGSTTPIETMTGNMISSNTGEVTLSNYGTGSYYWKARTIDNNGNASEWVSFIDGISLTGDFELFEGFEPYPYGYKFENNVPDTKKLTGGFTRYKIVLEPPYYDSVIVNDLKIIPGNKWDVFYEAFDTTKFNNNENALIDSFEALKLNGNTVFQGGNCYGMAVSAAMQYVNTGYLNNLVPTFSSQILTGNIRNVVNSPSTTSTGSWDIDNDTLKTILTLQLAQNSLHHLVADYNGTSSANQILTELKNNPNNTYVLSFYGIKEYTDEKFGISIPKEKPVAHTVVPYKVEGNRIYIWDNNIQFPKNRGDLAYNQYITVNEDGTWDDLYYKDKGFLYSGWTSFDSMSLINVNELYNSGSKTAPPGFNGFDYLYTLKGDSDIQVTDSEGRISGFSGGTILEGIPGVNVITPLEDELSGSTENTWKQIYLPKKQDLTVKVIAKSQENYDLMIAGGDYYTKLENVQTSTGQIDIFESKVDNLKIDFDDTKTGSYNLLTDNFQENNTGSIYIDQAPMIITPQEYTIDWIKVQTNETDSVTQNIDTDNDGNYDEQVKLPPVFQDLLAPTTNYSFSGELLLNNTGTYIDTVNIDLNSIDNEGGTGIDKIFYAIGTDTGTLIYVPYTEPITVNGVGNYTLNFYAVDKFGNIEITKTTNFSLVERPETYQGEISGYVYDDINSNGIKDTSEKTMAGWKICIDKNDNGTCEENSEPFNITNNDGYYEFNGLATGIYKTFEIPHQNWITTTPTSMYYIINLSNGQKVTNKSFGNTKTKGK